MKGSKVPFPVPGRSLFTYSFIHSFINRYSLNIYQSRSKTAAMHWAPRMSSFHKTEFQAFTKFALE